MPLPRFTPGAYKLKLVGSSIGAVVPILSCAFRGTELAWSDGVAAAGTVVATRASAVSAITGQRLKFIVFLPLATDLSASSEFVPRPVVPPPVFLPPPLRRPPSGDPDRAPGWIGSRAAYTGVVARVRSVPDHQLPPHSPGRAP